MVIAKEKKKEKWNLNKKEVDCFVDDDKEKQKEVKNVYEI
jgi:hypothetical protein